MSVWSDWRIGRKVVQMTRIVAALRDGVRDYPAGLGGYDIGKRSGVRSYPMYRLLSELEADGLIEGQFEDEMVGPGGRWREGIGWIDRKGNPARRLYRLTEAGERRFFGPR